MAEPLRFAAAVAAGLFAARLIGGAVLAGRRWYSDRTEISRLRERGGTRAARRRQRDTGGGGGISRLFRSVPAGDAAADLELVLLALATEMESGASVPQALAAVAAEAPTPLAGELAELAAHAARGDWIPALREWAARRGDRVLGDLAATLDVQRYTGGSPVPVMRRLAEMSRERRLLHAQSRSRSAEARYSAVVLAITPWAVTAYLMIFRPGLLAPLWQHPAGRAALAYGVVSWLLGVLWIRAMLRSVDRF